MAQSTIAIRIGDYMLYLFDGRLFIGDGVQPIDGSEIKNFTDMLSAKRVTIKKVKKDANDRS
jgi:hypothetical protein